MRVLCVMLMALLCGGCAAAAKQLYRPADTAATEWLIEGRQSGFGKISISINGTPVIDGKISLWSGAGDFTGMYSGRTIAASCSKSEGSGVRTRCVLYVNGDKATTIYFKVL